MDNYNSNYIDTRIAGTRPLLPPAILLEEIELSENGHETVIKGRKESSQILHGKEDRLLFVCGPCSIHDPAAALEYAKWLKPLANRFAGELVILMRTYFEKPRTVVGWKGLLNDPKIDGSFEINQGLRIGRKLLCEICDLGIPTAAEFLDTIHPQYIADTISWAAIGARTTESQVHRELSSGLSMPIGFKNGTSGNIQIAVDAVRSARVPHWFPSVTRQGVTAIFQTTGNPDGHLILRGGSRTGTNYDADSIKQTTELLKKYNLPQQLVVDCSHGNSQKDFKKQAQVAEDLALQIQNGQPFICGVMLESFIVEGRQDYETHKENTYGQSITDACIGLEQTEEIMKLLSDSVKKRRKNRFN